VDISRKKVKKMPRVDFEPGRYKPRGDLADILDNFEASFQTAQEIARRIGGVTGIPKGITLDQVEETIINSMTDGIPNWPSVSDKLGNAANRVYKGKKPFINR